MDWLFEGKDFYSLKIEELLERAFEVEEAINSLEVRRILLKQYLVKLTEEINEREKHLYEP